MKLVDFWRFVDKQESGCWVWSRSKNWKGYGQVYLPELFNGMLRTHKVAWYLTYGFWPKEGVHVGHKCDNRACCNPDHLELMTPKENVHDRVDKGRPGNRTTRKLTEEQVQEFWKRFHEGESVRSIARSFGVSHTVLFQIKRGECYRSMMHV